MKILNDIMYKRKTRVQAMSCIAIVTLASLVLSFMPMPLFALPEIESIENGSIDTSNPDENTLVIDATDNTIINYSSFSISEGNSVIVNLPSVDSQILNRVLGGEASSILGSLYCNGMFILVNEAGIYIGPNAQIDSASLIMATRDISNPDFLDGNYLFKRISKEELDILLLNEGTINIAAGGIGALIAGAVENRGVIATTASRVALAAGDAVKINLTANGDFSVTIDEPTAATVKDFNGNPVTEQIKNTGSIDAPGSQVILKAESVVDIFSHAINTEGMIKATKLEQRDGKISLIADKDIAVNAPLEATHIHIESEQTITTTADIKTDGGDIDIVSTQESVYQLDGDIEATGEGDIRIDAPDTIHLDRVITEYGTIKIGSIIEPDIISGNPHYISQARDFTITDKQEAEGSNVVSLTTQEGDLLRYAKDASLTLEAAQGHIKDLTDTPIYADYLGLIATGFDLTSYALTTDLHKTEGDITISSIETYNNLVTIVAEDLNLSYNKDNNLKLQTDNSITNLTGAVIPASTLTLMGNQIGSYSSPVYVDADTINVYRPEGIINISEMWGLGSTICIRGPAPSEGPDSWGSIVYNSDSHLILEAEQVSISTHLSEFSF
jgi:filamentous hemagglutinin family protein